MKLNVKVTRGIIFLILAAVLLWIMPTQIKVVAGEKITGRTFPRLLLTVMMLCSVLEIITGLLSKDKRYFVIDKASLYEFLWPALMFAIILAYLLLIPRIGFVLSSLLMGVGTLLFLRSRKPGYYIIVMITVFFVYLLFTQLLHVQLPRLI